MPTDHEALARQCEEAGADRQRELLDLGWRKLRGNEYVQTGVNHFYTFNAKLDAEAYLDAAMMLVPEAMRDEIEIKTLYRIARVALNLNHGPDGGPFYGSNECNSIPLALLAAILRARSEQV